MADQVAPVAPATGGVIRSLLPERSVEDVLAGKLRLVLGGTPFTLDVLTIDKADEWRAGLLVAFGDVVGQLEEQVNVPGVVAFLGSNTASMLVLIRAYDQAGVLPDNDWIRSHATEPEVLRAFVLILAASFPFIASAIDILATNPAALGMVLSEFGPRTPVGSPSSTSPSPTAGPSVKRVARSRTSS